MNPYRSDIVPVLSDDIPRGRFKPVRPEERPSSQAASRRALRTRAAIWALATRFEMAAKKMQPPQRERRVEGLRLTKGKPQICRTALTRSSRGREVSLDESQEGFTGWRGRFSLDAPMGGELWL